jgi:glycosyltransferase involved in cell wall biosynthesis
MNPLITVITPTTGNPMVRQALDGVKNQTYKNIQHLVVVDGKHPRAKPILQDYPNVDLVELPYATGTDQYNGHRIYGAMTYIARGDFLCFLDEDNWYDEKHIESLVEQLKSGNQWAYSLRKIVDQEGKYICNDDCESLGKWTSVINDMFIDVNCFMIPKQAALGFSPYWYRRARHPQEQPEVDRILSPFMMQNLKTFDTNGHYSVNYRVASRQDSVQAGFFLQGNEVMKQKYNGNLPWRKI